MITGLLLLATVIAVTWLCLWATDEASAPSGKWCPFELKDGDDDKPPSPDPRERPRWRSNPAIVRGRSERPWTRSGS